MGGGPQLRPFPAASSETSLKGEGVGEQSEDTFLHSCLNTFPLLTIPISLASGPQNRRRLLFGSPWAARWSSDTYHLPSALVYLTLTLCHSAVKTEHWATWHPFLWAPYLHYHSKWTKFALLLYIWLTVLIDHFSIWQLRKCFSLQTPWFTHTTKHNLYLILLLFIYREITHLHKLGQIPWREGPCLSLKTPQYPADTLQ